MKRNLLILLVVILMASLTIAAGGGTRITGVITAIDEDAQTIVVNNTTIQISHRYTAGGTYAAICTVVDANDCSSSSSPVTVTVSMKMRAPLSRADSAWM